MPALKVGRLFAPGIEGLGRWQSLPLALVCIALIVVLRVADPPFLQQLRLWQFDALQIAEPRALTNAPAIIVDIDEHSLSRYGQWPWPRSRIAMLVDRITQAGACPVRFDISDRSGICPGILLCSDHDVGLCPRVRSR